MTNKASRSWPQQSKSVSIEYYFDAPGTVFTCMSQRERSSNAKSYRHYYVPHALTTRFKDTFGANDVEVSFNVKEETPGWVIHGWTHEDDIDAVFDVFKQSLSRNWKFYEWSEHDTYTKAVFKANKGRSVSRRLWS